MSNKNILNTEIIRKSRKRGYDVFIISQLFILVDNRIRYLCNHLIDIKTYEWTIESKYGIIPKIIELGIYENKEGIFILKEKRYLNIEEKMFHLYDSFSDVYEIK